MKEPGRWIVSPCDEVARSDGSGRDRVDTLGPATQARAVRGAAAGARVPAAPPLSRDADRPHPRGRRVAGGLHQGLPKAAAGLRLARPRVGVALQDRLPLLPRRAEARTTPPRDRAAS